MLPILLLGICALLAVGLIAAASHWFEGEKIIRLLTGERSKLLTENAQLRNDLAAAQQWAPDLDQPIPYQLTDKRGLRAIK